MNLSFAYKDSVISPDDKNYVSIDLLSSDVKEVFLDIYPNLLRIRISKCINLEHVTLSNMPKLQVVDILDNENLQIVTFEQCPSIIAIEAGFCPNLTKITGISNVQYLSSPYSYKLELEKYHELIYLDLSTYFFDNRQFDVLNILKSSPNLECLICPVDDTINLSEITKHPSLKILQISSVKLNCDSIDEHSKLMALKISKIASSVMKKFLIICM